jgi:pilus assembly protein CpaC
LFPILTERPARVAAGLLVCLTAATPATLLAQASPSATPGQTVAAPPAAARGPQRAQGLVQEQADSPAPVRKRASSVQAPVETGQPQNMAIGDVVTLRLPNVARIAIGNGALVRATVVDDREIVLLAEATGRTTMHVWLRNGRQISHELEVVEVRPTRLLADLQAMLAEVPGIKVRPLGQRIVLEGRYPNREAAVKVRRLIDSFPQLLSLVPDAPLDADPLQLERMVQFDLRVIEVKRRALERLGIKWAETANGPTFATNALIYSNTPMRPIDGFAPVSTANPVKSFLGLATQISSALNFLEQRGDAWTLAEPRLSCRSGGEAKFLAGGEIPIPVPQGNGTIGVEYKQYGVRLEFKPLADAQQNIDSELMVEVSEPDTRNSNAGFVAFTTNRSVTRVALKAGEPMVIAGLLKERFEKGDDGVPGLSRLPLISGLFKSKERTSEKTELFIIATPRITGPQAESQQTELKAAQELRDELQRRVEGDLKRPEWQLADDQNFDPEKR